MDILEKIIAAKRQEVKRQKDAVKLALLENLLEEQPDCISFKGALLRSPGGIIAEFKRRSPSKDWIFREAKVEDVIPAYEQAGAAAISVLTDEPFFGGTLKDLQEARRLTKTTPLLRKDFVVDEYQLYQARLMGADAVLLIAAALTEQQTFQFAKTAHDLGLEVLLEIHQAEELGHLNEYVDVAGVNNRNLSTFETSLQTSYDLADRIPEDVVKISESGISRPETVFELRKAGFRGFLMGENFMKTARPGETLQAFMNDLIALTA